MRFNGMATRTESKRYAKRMGIPVTVKVEHKFILALLTFGTYKNYPLDAWHRELIVRKRNAINVSHIMIDGTELTMYLLL